MKRVGLLLLLPCLTLAAPIPTAHADGDDLGRAPDGCWQLRDGCPARTGESATPALEGPLEPAWEWAPDGGARIDEEPRVWRDRVYVSTRVGGKGMALHALRLRDGGRLAPPLEVPSPDSLDPSVWGDRVLLRAAPQRLEIHRLRGGKWSRIWSVDGASSFSDPILVDDRVWAMDGEQIVAWRPPSTDRLWTANGHFRGHLALRGRHLYALEYDEAGNAELVAIDAKTGERARAKAFVGHHGTNSPPSADYASRLVVLPERVFVHHGHPVTTRDGKPMHTTRVQRRDAGGDVGFLDEGLFDDAPLTASAGASSIGFAIDPELGRVLRLSGPDPTGKPLIWNLAAKSSHPEFAASEIPVTVASGVAYVGGRSFEISTRRILWDSGANLAFRPVPARDRLLVVPEAGRLQALRAAGRTDDPPIWFHDPASKDAADAPTAPIEADGRVLFTDGSVLEGHARLDPAAARVEVTAPKKKPTSHPLDAVVVVLGTDGRLLYAASTRAASAEVRVLAEGDHADDFVTLARDAFKSHDPALMTRLIGEAERRGAESKPLEFPRKQVAELQKKPMKADSAATEKVLDKERSLVAAEDAAVANAIAGALTDPRWPVRRRLVEAAIAQAVAGPEIEAAIRSELPAWLTATTPFRPEEWLPVADALRLSEARLVEAPKPGVKDLSRQQKEFGAALHTWRPDLVALETDSLLVLTPLAQPVRIASCVSMGELVCTALEDVFSGGTHLRKDPWPMTLLLFENREEYQRESKKQGSNPGLERFLEWTAGHYDPEAGVSRIWLPSTPDGFRQVMQVYAHELTHHWIDERCPLWRSADAKRDGRAPGYWIVEGMADFVAGFRWDLGNRTWDTFDPRSGALDVVANARAEQLLPWSTLFSISAVSFRGLDGNNAMQIARRWELGTASMVTALWMFYLQSTATCDYLYHSSDATRAALLACVHDYYTGTGDLSPASFAQRFGTTPEELGRRVVEYARGRMSGTVPPPSRR